MWITRNLETEVLKLAQTRPALLLTGIRQSGKSSLLRHLFPDAAYVTLDRLTDAEEAEENPSAFLDRWKGETPVILDEIQYAPALFRELKVRIDQNRERNGRWIFTGSQRFPLMKKAGESLAGRIGILELETLGASELRSAGFQTDLSDLLWKGGYPETWIRPEIGIRRYFEDYLQTYLEKDLRALMQVENIRAFRRFLRACAVRASQLVNFTDLSRDVGISPNTARSWVSLLESSGVVTLLEPWFANIGKRLAKSPKLYFCDQGLLCSILNIHGSADLSGHALEGQIWENFVFSELVRHPGVQATQNLFYYRDQNGVEIDFVVESGRRLALIEAKLSSVVSPARLNFSKVAAAVGERKTVSILACKTEETRPVHRKDYTLQNPLLTPWDFQL